MVEGESPHYTSFKWIPPAEFDRVLSKYFKKIEVTTDKTTDIYVCSR